MSTLLQVNSLTTILPNHAAVVDGISFTVHAGETLALLGESGCGKSMTALSLLRLLPDGLSNMSGQALLNGVNLFSLPESEMCRVRGGQVAMIFQEPGLSLNPVLTIGQQIREVLALHQPKLNNEGHCISLLQQVGIPDAAQRISAYSFQLSGGMKQRVMIAMALAGKPQLLIADEPTTALDVTMQAQVLELLRAQQQATGMGMLLITHDLGVVAENADQVAVMYAGQIIETGSRAALFEQPLHPYTQKLFAALPEGKREQGLVAIAGRVPAAGSIKQGCRFVDRCELSMPCCKEKSPDFIMLKSQGVACFLYQEGIAQPKLKPQAVSFKTNTQQDKTTSLLTLNDLKVHFPIRKGILQRVIGQVKAVDGVSLTIQTGRTVALVGESGCGKTTLGKALLQLTEATAGQIHFSGQDWHISEQAAPKNWGRNMQMVFQDPYASLNPKMRVAEIIEEGMQALKIGGTKQQRQQLVDSLLQQVGLASESKWRYPHEFSGGQRQRIAIARALAVSPRLLICDEPTSALDVSVQAQILNLLKELQAELGLAYLFITHNLSVVEYLADDVYVMYLGRIVESGSVEQVLNQPRHPYTRALLSAIPRVSGKKIERIQLTGELPSPANPPKGCHFAPRCPQADEHCLLDYPATKKVADKHWVACNKL